jgi:hypothetical protein
VEGGCDCHEERHDRIGSDEISLWYYILGTCLSHFIISLLFTGSSRARNENTQRKLLNSMCTDVVIPSYFSL